MPGTQLLRVALAALILLAVVGGWRFWTYQSDEPLRKGIGALKEGDFGRSLDLIAPMARAGHREAQRTLGEMYALGLGVEADEIVAEVWFRRAECHCADPGQAEYDLGLDLLYKKPRDENHALKWIRRAAEAGHRRAQALLATPSIEGEGLASVAPAESRYWKQVISVTKVSAP